jgi:glycosyltransferase involved in cell wall biosynthesis
MEGRLRTARLHQQHGEFADARAVLTAGIRQTPRFPLYYECLGDILLQEGQLLAAKRCYEQALALCRDPRVLAMKSRRIDRLMGAERESPRNILSCATAVAAAAGMKEPPLVCGDLVKNYLCDPEKRQGGARTINRRPIEPGTEPLVSVITVCRNAVGKLGDAIRSVAEQTYRNLEQIVVDGASTDGTLDLLVDLCDGLEYWVSEPDAGVYDAMNKALRLASGEFIVILNADDRLYPDFVARSLGVLRETGADVSFCDYSSEVGSVRCGEVDAGILLSQLNVKHNTFLCHRSAFERIGGFDPLRTVNADAKWIRAAYLNGFRFQGIRREMVFYSSTGLSSGNSPGARRIIIEESVSLIRQCFPLLSALEAEALYLSNFNTHQFDVVADIYRRMASGDALLREAMRSFIGFNLFCREGYQLRPSDPAQARRVVGYSSLVGARIPIPVTGEESRNPVSMFISAVQLAAAQADEKQEGTVLHFVRDFSSPSETFIHELITDLARREPNRLHVVLCDRRRLERERPFPNVLVLPWDTTDATLRRSLYDLLWERLKPRLVIAHFALNGFWLFERLGHEQRRTPTINMCHGIDVFAVDTNPGYSRYIRKYCSYSPYHCFTVVSEFLREQLAAAGVPKSRIHLVHNSISDAFFLNRKRDGFFGGGRPLRILNVGRLIDWKGHRFLLEAVALVRARSKFALDLTIVYGGMAQDYEALKSLSARLGVDECTRFVEFVDLASDPQFFARHDLFVLPSTVDESVPPRTETFGLSILEAIAAGLPVIGTNAGGIPEVLGPANPQARLVRHGSSQEIADAILAMLEHPEGVFRDNREYAVDRLAAFSKDQRYARLRMVEASIIAQRRRVFHFCALGKGGAAGATLNIHRALLEAGWDSWFVTRDCEEARMDRYEANVIFLAADEGHSFRSGEGVAKPGFTIFSLDSESISNRRLGALVDGVSLINLAWTARFLSSGNIAYLSNLGVPITLTLRDMQPITGGCHYFHGCSGWLDDCGACPQVMGQEVDAARATLERKRSSWNRSNLTFVALSQHSRGILERSPVARDCRIRVMANPVDEKRFYPLPDRLSLRDSLGLPRGFLIGYLPSYGSLVKGHQELVRSLRLLRRMEAELDVALAVLSGERLDDSQLPFPVRLMAHTSDVGELRSFYNAVDVVVVPSLEETFSNTTLEALACGTPVVGFRTGVLAEVLSDPRVGGVVPVGDCYALAREIRRVALEGSDSDRCVEVARAMSGWSQQANAYVELYEELVGIARSSPPS